MTDIMDNDIRRGLQKMIGKQVGGIFRTDGSARLQWPDSDGRIPKDMQLYTVTEAHLVNNIGIALVEIGLKNENESFLFIFPFAHINPNED